ncbi:hypothetical protein EV646_112310, partial [Kribbella antiqua]
MRTFAATQPGGDHPVSADTVTLTANPTFSRPGCCAHCCTGDSAVTDDAYLSDAYDYVPDDLHYPTDAEIPGGPLVLTEQEWLDAELDDALGGHRYSRVDEFEWQEWHGVDQDEAERALLALGAPAWLSLPPGGALATALEDTRPRAMSPIALIELLKAANRMAGWAEALKAEAMASFYRHRHAEHAEAPRPTQVDSKGRPIDPDRSWHAEIALALGLSPTTVARHVTTALRLTTTL